MRQLLCALAQFIKQARIFDRDHRLIGEVGDKFGLLVGKRLDLLPENRDGTNQLVFLEHRYDYKRTGSSEVGQRYHIWIALEIRRLRPDIIDMDRLVGSL